MKPLIATLNSDDTLSAPGGSGRCTASCLALGLALWLCGTQTLGDDATALATRARQAFDRATARLASAPSDEDAEWQFARACFDLAGFATNSAQRASIAEQGIAASRRLVARKPESASGNYYLAMNLGQLARTKLLGALKLVSEMETLFLRVTELDANFDYAGPHRCLGLLYRDAPGWPASVGNRKKSRLHLERAVALSPDHPENQLVLLESQLKWGLEKEARASLDEVAKVLRVARDRLAGERWQADWADWDRRWQSVLEALNADAPLSPAQVAP